MIKDFFHFLYKFLINIIAPPFCLFCNKDLLKRQHLCRDCLLQMTPIVPYDFFISRSKIVRIYAASAYKNPLKKLLLAKHQGNASLTHALGSIISDQIILKHLDFDVLVPIPLHWSRYAARGFNQADIIAQQIAQKTGKPVHNLLKRKIKTEYQSRLKIEDREDNLENAFEVNQKYKDFITDKKILFIDDLFTTGSTIKAAFKALLVYKPEKVDAFVACRAFK